LFEDIINVVDAAFDKLLPALAAKHVAALSAHPSHMIEIEFLDEPNPNERYCRFGTDPGGMVIPIRSK
jgi:hypothetical protein